MTFSGYETYKDDYLHTQDVIDGGFAYGPDRVTVSLPAAPSSGVKVRQGNPTQNQIAVAASAFGYSVTDQVFTIWANTLRADPSDESSAAIVPVEYDRITASGVSWIIRWVKTTVYGTQFLCYCNRMPDTEY